MSVCVCEKEQERECVHIQHTMQNIRDLQCYFEKRKTLFGQHDTMPQQIRQGRASYATLHCVMTYINHRSCTNAMKHIWYVMSIYGLTDKEHHIPDNK